MMELKAPVNVNVFDVTEASAKLSWEKAEDGKEAVGYYIYVGGNKLNKELIVSTSYDLKNLKADTQYSVQITAVDADGNESEKSEKETFKTLKAESEKEEQTPTPIPTPTPTPEPAPTPDDKDSICKTEAVKTGDHGSVFVWAAGILISVSAVSVVLKRGKYR